tara:strand:- start:7000 stop:7329 length:330 start_codon:yes stop_codon:yes gene_type:complete
VIDLKSVTKKIMNEFEKGKNMQNDLKDRTRDEQEHNDPIEEKKENFDRMQEEYNDLDSEGIYSPEQTKRHVIIQAMVDDWREKNVDPYFLGLDFWSYLEDELVSQRLKL